MRTPSHADQQALSATEAAGLRAVTPRRLERWRQAGLIPKPLRRWPGRGRGSASTYTDDQLAEIVNVARCVPICRRLDHVALWMFLKGAPIEEHAVRTALRNLIGQVVDHLEHAAGSDPVDQASVLTDQITSRPNPWRRRARGVRPTADSFYVGGPEGERQDPARDSLSALVLLATTGSAELGNVDSVTGLLSDFIPEGTDVLFDVDTSAKTETLLRERFSLRALVTYPDLVRLDVLRDAADAYGLTDLPRGSDAQAANPPEIEDYFLVLLFALMLDTLNENAP